MTTTECRECAAGRQQAVNCDIAWHCAEHGMGRLDVGAILEALAQARAQLAALKDAAKTLQRVQFILGGHTDTCADCDETALRENVDHALQLMRAEVPPIVETLCKKARP